MRNNYTKQRPPQFQVLSSDQLEEIHLATLEILRYTGVRFLYEQALAVLRAAGAYISDGNRVKFPAGLVQQALGTAPNRIVMCDRNGEPAMRLEGRRVYYGTGSDTLYVSDPYTGAHHQWKTQDICAVYRLCDALPHIHFQMSAGIPTDCPQGVSAYQWQYVHLVQLTTKPVVFVCHDLEDCQSIIDMASIALGDISRLQECPIILLYTESTSPLQQSETALEKLMLMAENALPVVHSPGPMMCATAPATIAGALAMANAESLSALVLHQLVKPHAPFVYGTAGHSLDMKTAQCCYASPEFQLFETAISELGRYYGLPTWGYAGCSDAKLMDEQAAAEAMYSVLMTQFTGTNLVHDVGYLESGLMTSMDMITFTDELIGMTNHIVKGIEVSDETLALDTIHEVGPAGNFMADPHTLRHYRDFWYPHIFDRNSHKDWQARGEVPMREKVNRRTREIIENHQPETLPQDKVVRIMECLHLTQNKAKA